MLAAAPVFTRTIVADLLIPLYNVLDSNVTQARGVDTTPKYTKRAVFLALV